MNVCMYVCVHFPKMITSNLPIISSMSSSVLLCFSSDCCRTGTVDAVELFVSVLMDTEVDGVNISLDRASFE